MSSTAIQEAVGVDDLRSLVPLLARLERDVSDAERVDQLAVLEEVKAVCAAAQARVTVEFAASQERVAQEWQARAKECADGSDVDGWVAAREQARRRGRGVWGWRWRWSTGYPAPWPRWRSGR